MTKREKIISVIIFGIYMLLLTWLILFKFSTDFINLPFKRNINLIPFAEPKLVNGKVDISEMLYNFAVFVPFGVYIGMFFTKFKFFIKLILPFCLSLLYEVIQYVFAIGLSDITDVITNTAGGIFGLLCFELLCSILKKKVITVINIIGFAVELIAFVLLSVIIL